MRSAGALAAGGRLVAWLCLAGIACLIGLVLPASTARAAEPCTTCHEVSIKASVHEPVGCEGCHAGVGEGPHQPPAPKVDCATCHSDEGTKFSTSVHSRAKLNGGSFTCATCHGNHSIPSVQAADSPVSRARVHNTCGKCHGSLKFVREQGGLFSTQPFFAYNESVHGRTVEKGETAAAICTDCHGFHDVVRPSDPASPVFRSRIPSTCGGCHGDVFKEYSESIHGRAAAAGISASPVCTDCHGIHSIKAPDDPSSSVAARAVARSTCGQCHASERLTTEFGVPRQRVQSYYDSYHGLESALGSVKTANCASCHGVHNILPSSDPRSTIHAANLPGTCGKCHPGASENFARGQIHLVSAPPRGPGGGAPAAEEAFGSKVVRVVRVFYLSLIVLVIGGMAAHNLLDFFVRARQVVRGLGATHLRLTVAERVQHGLLFGSFATLVATGFALKFPDSGWVRWLFVGSPVVRSTLHRAAAVVLMVLAGWHLGWLLFSARGREQRRALWPAGADIRELAATLRRNLGLAAQAPATDRFGYVEKAEYWALLWGTVIMAATGVVLWAQDSALRWLPKWGLDVATVIHYYEAWLATLAILVWHLYFTVMRPGNRSRRWSWLTGRLTEEEWREEHPAEHARLTGGDEGPRASAKEGTDG
jgi:cytochrome b subunit of formate dehydrogenase